MRAGHSSRAVTMRQSLYCGLTGGAADDAGWRRRSVTTPNWITGMMTILRIAFDVASSVAVTMIVAMDLVGVAFLLLLDRVTKRAAPA